MNHRKAMALLQDAMDGKLTLAEQPALEQHLSECAQCRAYADELSALEENLARSLQSRYPDRPAQIHRVAELLAQAGYPSRTPEELLAAVDAWRAERLVPRKSIRQLAGAFIAELEEGTRRHLVPHLPASLRGVPRANIEFLPIEDAWFSGSMNYVGRARNRDRSPRYEATYEINASLQISVPEFAQLVSHEVVPGHVTNFALVQGLYVRGKLPFEATVLTMNTRLAALSEGIANNAPELAASGEAKKFLAFFTDDFVRGDTVDLQLGADGTVAARHNGKTLGTMKSHRLAHGLLAIYFGEKPADEGLKQGMLGGKS